MKFLLVPVFLVLTISTAIQCFESLDCVDSTDCRGDLSCVHGQCRVAPHPMVRIPKNQEGGSDIIPCDPVCAPSQACYWGKCVQASRKFHALRKSWPYCFFDYECEGLLNQCIAGMCLY